PATGVAHGVLPSCPFDWAGFGTPKGNSWRRRAARGEPRWRGKKWAKRGIVPFGRFCGDRRHGLAQVVPPFTRPPIAQLLSQIGSVLSLQQWRVRPFALGVIVTGTAARDAGSRVTVLIEPSASTPFFPVRLQRPIGRRRRKACKIGRRLRKVAVVDIGRAGLHLAAIVAAAAVTKILNLLHD